MTLNFPIHYLSLNQLFRSCIFWEGMSYALLSSWLDQKMLPVNILIEFWSFIPLFLFFNSSIRGFQDVSAQGTEGLAMKESELVKMTLHWSQRV